MGFRDENEALRARTKAAEERARRAETQRERMERELAEAKANDESDARRIAELEERLAKLDPGSLEAAKSKAGNGMRMALVGVVAAIVLVVGLMVFFLVSTGAEKHEEAVVASAVADSAAVPVSPAPPAAAVEPAGPLERIRLAGVVRSADGVDGLEEGDGCVADLGIAAGWSQLQVRCGAGDRVATVYDGGEAPAMGIVQVSDQVMEASTIPGYVTRTMSYSRTGQWSGPHPQIQLDPDQHAARVWLQGIEARDVLLHIESSDFGPGVKALSEHTTGTIARGTIAKLALQGDVPGALGDLDTDDCVLRTEPVPRSGAGAHTARFVARCGDRILYGAGRSGWNPAPANGEVVGPVEDPNMSATDTDPAMTFTGDTLTLVEPQWRVVFDIEPHPRCTLAEGSWVGTLRGEDGQLQSGLSIADGELTLPSGEVLMGTEDMRCHEGVARWTLEDGTTMLDGRFGPSFATYVGRLGTGQLIELYRN